MKLQGRDLAAGLRGDDVSLLQFELRQLGFSILDQEVTRKLFGNSTVEAVKLFQKNRQLRDTGVVDEITATAINRDFDALSLVQGQVWQDDDTLLRSGKVQAFDKDLRREQLLGEVRISDQGRYEIRYSSDKFQRIEKRQANLCLRVLDTDGKLLFESEVIFNVPANQIIDIVLAERPRLAEFQAYLNEIKPLLERVTLAELTEADVDFIAAETRISAMHIAWLVVAHQYHATLAIEPELFYGLFRANAPTLLSTLLMQSSKTLRLALDTAIEQNIIRSRTDAELEQAVAALLKHRREHLFNSAAPDLARSTLLGAAGLNADQQAQFLEAYLNFDGEAEAFWRSLEQTTLASQVRAIQDSLQLGLLTQNNVPLLQALRGQRIRSIRDLTRIQPGELERIILRSKEILAAIPSDGDAEKDEDKSRRFSNELFDVLHETMPTVFVQEAFVRSTDATRADAGRILSRLPNFELRDDDLEQALRDNPAAQTGIKDPQKSIGLLKGMQRTLRVAPRAAHAQLLLDDGLDSAASIATLSASEFQKRYADKLGGMAQANVYYHRAQQISDSVLAIMSTLQQSITDVLPDVISSVPDSVKSLPNFATLFGSQLLCACSHCRSVLSPAAYLVDLLEFLNPKSPTKPISKLRSKRPDLEHILLTCDNTHTPLPYIDLVNEVLEFYVAQGKLTAAVAHNSDGVSADELNANPQFVMQAAYETLSTAVFPPTLPFHRPLEITRLYLRHLGTSCSELMRLCQRDGIPSEIAIAVESLSLSPMERGILTGVTARPLADFYQLPTSTPPESLSTIKVSTFLSSTSSTFEQLTELLKTEYLNPSGAIKLVDEDNPPQCNLQRVKLTGLTPKFWRDVHRLLRLQRITGWTLQDLDLVLVAFQVEDIDDETLVRLADLKQLQSITQVTTEVLASLIGNMSAQAPTSLFHKLFLNKAVLSSSTGSDFEAVRNGNSTVGLGAHRSTISAALRLSAIEFELLMDHLGYTDSTVMTLESLSWLHRYAALARAIKFSIHDLVDLSTLTKLPPFAAREPRVTLRFLEAAQTVRESGFVIAELNYLYRHRSPSVSPQQPTLETQLRLLQTIQSSLLASQNGPSDEDDELALLRQQGLVIQILSEEEGIDSRSMTRLLQNCLQSIANPSRPLLDAFLRLKDISDLTELTNRFAGDVETVPVASDLDAELVAILDGLLRLQKSTILVRSFGMTTSEIQLFTEQGARFSGFDWNALPIKTVDSAEGNQQFQAWYRLAGWYRVRQSLPRLTVELAAVGLAATSDSQTDPSLPKADRRDSAIEQLKLATGWPHEELDFLVGPSGFNLGQATDFFDERTLARLQACIQLSRRLGVACSTLFQWSSLASSSSDANGSSGSLNWALSDAAVATAKAKYSEAEWLRIAKTLNDELRERQKAALVAYVLAHDAEVKKAGITDGNGLFEYFLIDVEMSACGKTSRIKQAISSVQLFIQRSLLNLEAGVSPLSIDVSRWEWMKNYRVWEANRKVFLYPENWIEPELRDDKSPFFKELEAALLQNDLSWSTAEAAYVQYLEKLEQVSRLQPCGMYLEEAVEAGDDEILHVFARTMSSPHRHYYRRLVGGQHWTPWEKLEQEIDGEHLIPLVRNRRLYLAWLNFEEKPDKNQELPHPFVQSREHWRWLNQAYPKWRDEHKEWRQSHASWRAKKALKEGLELATKTTDKQFPSIELGEEPAEPRMPEEPPFSIFPSLTHWEIKLAWMEYKDGQWSAKQTSTHRLESPHVQTTFYDWYKQEPYRTLKQENDKYGFIPPDSEGKLAPTIFSVYLPERETHFARIVDLSMTGNGDDEADDDGIVIGLYRRYAHEADVFQQHKFPIKGFDLLGFFRIHCGRKVDIVPLDEPISLPFQSLKRPDDTTNRDMTFAHSGKKVALSVTPAKKRRDILRKGPSPFELLYEHQHPEFRLAAPFQNFFYHDQAKTYFATYDIETPSNVLRVPTHAIFGISLSTHTVLVESIAKRQLDPLKDELPTNRLRKSPAMANRDAAGRQVMRLSNSSNPPKVASRGQGPTWRFNAKRNSASMGKIGHAGAGAWLGSKSWLPANHIDSVTLARQGLRFETFFHPHLCRWTQRLYRDGLPGLINRDSQQLDHKGKKGKSLFEDLYDPSSMVIRPYPTERVDFEQGAYATYNWELFFHIPMLIAVSLSRNQRFEDAMKWFHFIFNPMTDDPGSSRNRYWNALPFYKNAMPEHEQIQNMLLKLAGEKPGWKEIEAQINQWRSNPFNPHLLARMRLTAYQKHVVMKYIDNIISWADQLFSRDTLESINEATLLYVLAGNILGKRPQVVVGHSQASPKSYHQLSQQLDAFGNALADAEAAVPYNSVLSKGSAQSLATASSKQKAPQAQTGLSGYGVFKSATRMLHFCVPPNEDMLRYWDTVEDRLFKIRHCLNIEGASRQLPLFEPPIDPALLVKAKAVGLDLGSVLSDLFAPLPHYRFNVMLQKAVEVCTELKSLGAAFLSAFEKRDAEKISNLRASQETSFLKYVRDIKRLQIDEAKSNIEALNKSRHTVEARYNFYRDIERLSASENEQLDDMLTAHRFSLTSQGLQAAASAAFYVPNFTTGTEGVGPVITVEVGGSTIGPAVQSGATIASMIAAEYSFQATRSSIVSGYARRWNDWKLQEKLAARELEQIQQQIAAAEIRLAIAEKELDNHEQQIANSQAVEELLRSKYTNDELYNWMIAQMSKVYFQMYKLAYDLGKRAERTYRNELGLDDSDFVRFGYWDNLRKGLLAGEQLALDLKRMDVAYLEKNKREYELMKHVSLLQLDPQALILLRQTGECEFRIPEWYFDLDNPGHYLRRIKNVSLSIPCVTGPYTSVNCTLSLQHSTTRVAIGNSNDADSYPRKSGDDARFVDSFGTIQSIVASSAQHDSGLFETNLHDQRYLPFEYAGAISTWKLRLPADPRSEFAQFDYDTISDVVLHVGYTARDGGDALRRAAIDSAKLATEPDGSPRWLTRLFSLRQEFPTEWAKFQNQVATDGSSHSLTFNLRREHYPYWARNLKAVAQVQFFVRSHEQPPSGKLDLSIISGPSDNAVEKTLPLTAQANQGGLFVGELAQPFAEPIGDLKIVLPLKSMSDIWMAVSLSMSET